MRTRPITYLLVPAAMLLGLAPEALARGTRSLRPDVTLPATAMPTGGASPAPQADAPTGPGGGAPNPGAPESSTTTQTIVQIQVSGCSSHCHGTAQTQAAQQQAASVQRVTGGRRAGPPERPARTTAAKGKSRHTTRVTRGQIGCLAHCFGKTTRGVRVRGHRCNLHQLLRALAAGQSVAPASAAGNTQSTVRQSSYQSQHGQRSLTTRRQRSSQSSITIQSVRMSRRLTDTLRSSLTSSASPVAAAVTDTVQSIWQLQIGCLSHCSHTRQYQQAKQTSMTIQLVAPLATAGAAQDNTAQSIWQLQVGCLVWCFSASEHQLAASRHVTVSTAAAPRPTSPGRSRTVQIESTVAAQSGGSGVTIVASSGQVIAAPALRPNGESRRHPHVVAHRRHLTPARTGTPHRPVQTSSAVSAPADSAHVVLGGVAGLIVLLAATAATRIASRRRRP
jgi:hypothetical protein